MGFENEAFVNFDKTFWPKPLPQGVEGIVSRLNILGDEPVQVVLFQSIGQLPVRQGAFFDLDDQCQDKINIVSFGTDTGIAVNNRQDGFHVNGGKVGDEILFLLRQVAKITG